MDYNKRLLNEALAGNRGSLKELEANAASGSSDAQFCLAQFHACRKEGEDSLSLYWMKKAASNGCNEARKFLGLSFVEKKEDGFELSSEDIILGVRLLLNIFG